MIDEFELASGHASAGDEHGAVAAAQLVDVVQALERVEDDLEDRADLLVPVERELVGQRRAHDRVGGERVDCGAEISSLHRAAERELGGCACERGHGASFGEIGQCDMLA